MLILIFSSVPKTARYQTDILKLARKKANKIMKNKLNMQLFVTKNAQKHTFCHKCVAKCVL